MSIFFLTSSYSSPHLGHTSLIVFVWPVVTLGKVFFKQTVVIPRFTLFLTTLFTIRSVFFRRRLWTH